MDYDKLKEGKQENYFRIILRYIAIFDSLLLILLKILSNSEINVGFDGR